MRALVCSDLTLSLNREQAPGKSHKHHYPTLPVGKLRQPSLVVPLDTSQQVFVMMLEEHLDREACWCCLCEVGNVLFWVLPKILQLAQLAISPLWQMLCHSCGPSPDLRSLSVSPAFPFHFITPPKLSIPSLLVSPASSCSPTAHQLAQNANHRLIFLGLR